MENLSTIRIKDWQIFAEVSRAKSIREAGRRLSMTSGQVSKTIRLLESRLSVRLFKRSTSGMLLTEKGTEIVQIATELLANAQKMEAILGGGKSDRQGSTLAVAGTSFLTTHLLAPVLSEVAKNYPNQSFRFLDLAPDQLIPVGLRSAFELAAHFGKIPWPGTWVSELIGKSKWVLCVRSQHPLSLRPSLPQVLEFPFVLPTYWTSEGLVRGNDQFPISGSKRKPGFETATADTAVPILLNTDQMAFLPELLVQPWVKSKALRLLTVKGLPVVEKELYLSARAEAVSVKIFNGFVQALKARL